MGRLFYADNIIHLLLCLNRSHLQNGELLSLYSYTAALSQDLLISHRSAINIGPCETTIKGIKET